MTTIQRLLSSAVYAAPSETGSAEHKLTTTEIKIIGNLKEMYKASYEKDSTLSDALILTIVNKVVQASDDTTGDNADIERVKKMQEAEDQILAADLAAGNSIKAKAVDFAIKGNADAILIGELTAQLDANRRRKRGAANFLILLEKTYTKDELNACPEVGLEKPKSGALSNKAYDLYSVPGQAARGSFYRDLATAWGPGKIAFDTWKASSGKVGIYAEGTMDERTRDGIIQDSKDDYEAVVRVTRDAFRLHQKMAACNELDHIEVSYDYDEVNNERVLTYAKKPIVIEEIGRPRNYVRKAVGEFLKCDPSKALTVAVKAGGKPSDYFTALVNTMGKAPTPAGDKKDEVNKVKIITSEGKFDEYLAELTAATKVQAIDVALRKKIGNSKTIDVAWVRTVGDLHHYLDGLMRTLQPIYDRIIDDEATSAAAKKLAEMDSQKNTGTNG